MKKKLNQEAYQAYYNTSSSNNCINNAPNTNNLNGINLNIQSSPIAGITQSNSNSQNVNGQLPSTAINAQDNGMGHENNVYG